MSLNVALGLRSLNHASGMRSWNLALGLTSQNLGLGLTSLVVNFLEMLWTLKECSFTTLESRQWPVGHCHEQFPHVGINCEDCIVNMWKKYKVKITKIKLWKVFLDFRHYWLVLEFSVINVISLPLPFVSYSLWDILISKVRKNVGKTLLHILLMLFMLLKFE